MYLFHCKIKIYNRYFTVAIQDSWNTTGCEQFSSILLMLISMNIKKTVKMGQRCLTS